MKRSRLSMVLIVSLMIFTVGCHLFRGPNQREINAAKTAVVDVKDSLYVPNDSELVKEKVFYASHPENYPGCVAGVTELAYKTPRDFKYVLTAYRRELPKGGWIPDPTTTHDQEYVDFFVKKEQIHLTISDNPIRADLLKIDTTDDNVKDKNIYYVQLYYYTPSIYECSE